MKKFLAGIALTALVTMSIPASASYITGSVASLVEKIAGANEDVLTDGAFENWSMLNYADNFDVWNQVSDSPVAAGSWARSEDEYAGTYAMELLSVVPDGPEYAAAGLVQFETVVGGETFQARFYAKQNIGTASVEVAAYCFDEDTGTDYVYSITDGAWEDTATIGADEVYETISMTGTYGLKSTSIRTLPAGVEEAYFLIESFSSNQNDSVLIDGFEQLTDGIDGATNGGFESWTAYANQLSPLLSWAFAAGVDWEFEPGANSSAIYRETTNVQAGTYAVRMDVKNTASGTINRGFVYQAYSGGDALDVTTPHVYYRANEVLNSYVIFLDASPGVHTEVWDFVTETWDVLGTTVTSLPGTDNAKTLVNSTSYQEYNSLDDEVTVPTSGNLVMVLMSESGAGAPDTVDSFYFDTADLQAYVPGNQVQVFQNRAPQIDIADLDSGDRIFEYTFENGDVGLALGGTGVFQTDLAALDFSDVVVTVADAIALDSPATKSDVINISHGAIATSAANLSGGTPPIDFTTTGQTLSYTVPTGFKSMCSTYLVEIVSSSGANGDAVITVGTSGGGYNDVATIPGGITDDAYAGTSAATAILPADTGVYINVSGADSGTTLTGKVHLFCTEFAI